MRLDLSGRIFGPVGDGYLRVGGGSGKVGAPIGRGTYLTLCIALIPRPPVRTLLPRLKSLLNLERIWVESGIVETSTQAKFSQSSEPHEQRVRVDVDRIALTWRHPSSQNEASKRMNKGSSYGHRPRHARTPSQQKRIRMRLKHPLPPPKLHYPHSVTRPPINPPLRSRPLRSSPTLRRILQTREIGHGGRNGPYL